MRALDPNNLPPRLLTAEEARAYLSGCNPASLVPPTRIGRMVRWDRAAIDKALNERNGIEPAQQAANNDDPEAAFAQWKGRHGSAAGRP